MQRRAMMRALGMTTRQNNSHPCASTGARTRTASFTSSHREQQSPSKEKAKATEILLLPGDEFVLSPTNISSTLYEMKGLHCQYAVEEKYNLDSAQKSFIIRQSTIDTSCSSHSGGNLPPTQDQSVTLGLPVRSLHINEIKDGVIGAAGTGATTWESSIVMSLYFAMRPELLQGRVLELGSGVGVAGLLTNIMTALSLQHVPLHLMNEMESLTLSDYSQEVLRQCRDNLQRNISSSTTHTNRKNIGTSSPSLVDMDVCYLNWYDFMDSDCMENCNHVTFDTIIASDVIYRKNDVIYLAATLSKCLAERSTCMEDNDNHHEHVIHIFGPNNRAALHDLIQELRDNWDMEVKTELLVMERYRLQPSACTYGKEEPNPSSLLYPSLLDSQHDSDVEYQQYASRKEASFLHVTVSRKSDEACTSEKEYDINDLD